MSIATALRMPWGMKVEAKRAILTLWLKRFVSNNTCVNRIRTPEFGYYSGYGYCICELILREVPNPDQEKNVPHYNHPLQISFSWHLYALPNGTSPQKKIL